MGFNRHSKAVMVLSDLAAQAHQIAEAALFSPKQYWRASALLCSLLLGLPVGSAPFAAAAGVLRCLYDSDVDTAAVTMIVALV